MNTLYRLIKRASAWAEKNGRAGWLLALGLLVALGLGVGRGGEKTDIRSRETQQTTEAAGTTVTGGVTKITVEEPAEGGRKTTIENEGGTIKREEARVITVTKETRIIQRVPAKERFAVGVDVPFSGAAVRVGGTVRVIKVFGIGVACGASLEPLEPKSASARVMLLL